MRLTFVYTAILAVLLLAASLITDVPPSVPVHADALPDCTDHDVTAWHGKTDAGATCDYHHEHGDDPALGDAVFGQTRLLFANGQTLGYPWLTSEAENHEELKHAFHKCTVDLNRGAGSALSGSTAYINDLRICAHRDGSAGAAVRYHSAIIEVNICRLSDGVCGIMGFGLHPDYNQLLVDNVYVPLPGDSPWNNNFRQHFSDLTTASWVQQLGHDYAALSWQFFDVFGPTDAQDPATMHRYCEEQSIPYSACANDNSHQRVYGLRVWTPNQYNIGWPLSVGQARIAQLDPDGDGLLNGVFCTDPKTGDWLNYGTCAPSSANAPVWLINVPVDVQSFNGPCCDREYDTGPGELRWPN